MKIIKMPKVGNTVKSCLLSKWEVKEGEYVKSGELLFTYETDKTQLEYVSELSGYLLKIIVGEGEEVDVFSDVAIIGEKNEKFTYQLDNSNKLDNNINESEIVKKQNKVNYATSESTSAINKLSPRAKQVALKLGISNFDEISSSGANNVIMEQDIINYYQNVNKRLELPSSENSNTNSGDEITYVPYSQVRKAIKNKMTQGLTLASSVSLSHSANVSTLLSIHKRMKESQSTWYPTINDLIVYALSRVVINYPEVNSTFDDKGYFTYNYVNVGVAIDRGEGLYVPVVKNANKLSLQQLSNEIKRLSIKVVEKKIQMSDMENGTISITNVGNTGIEMFTPILNYPQNSILGVGAIINKLQIVDGENKIVPIITFSLTFNHNTFDGLLGAKFLDKFCKTVENLDLLFIK